MLGMEDIVGLLLLDRLKNAGMVGIGLVGLRHCALCGSGDMDEVVGGVKFLARLAPTGMLPFSFLEFISSFVGEIVLCSLLVVISSDRLLGLLNE